MMGMRMPQTCSAVFKRQVINLRNAASGWVINLRNAAFGWVINLRNAASSWLIHLNGAVVHFAKGRYFLPGALGLNQTPAQWVMGIPHPGIICEDLNVTSHF
jgi:hypothetical protein